MNICIIAPAFPSKRNPIINIFIYRQAKALAEREHKVFVVGGDTDSRKEGGMIVYARPGPFKSALLASRVMLKIPRESFWLLKNIGPKGTVGRLALVQITCGLLEREKIDIVDGNYADYGAVVAYLVSKIHKIKYIVTCHGSDIVEVEDTVFRVLPEGQRQVVNNALENAACIIAPSHSLANEIKKYCSEKKITIVHNAIDLNQFKPSTKTIFNRKTVLSVGLLVEGKGYEYLLKAIKKILEKSKDVDFLIIGEGLEETKLRRLAEELKISGNVIFRGFVPNEELSKYYSSSVFFALATLREGFGIVFTEAMACGVPVVSTNVAAVPEVVGDAGILVEPKNPDQLAEAMLKLLTDEDLRQELSKKALEQSKKFSIEKRIDKIEKIYETYSK